MLILVSRYWTRFKPKAIFTSSYQTHLKLGNIYISLPKQIKLKAMFIARYQTHVKLKAMFISRYQTNLKPRRCL
jgi:hypothetical protein